ncbi:MAG: hydrolase [Parcubacteria group bacterium 21-54-25]|nr:MAG: hydrolase [Parcubacteria group bacterium 21-54-25]HQU07549.1 hydrolase [Candidatus Paceibacterota bacterium]
MTTIETKREKLQINPVATALVAIDLQKGIVGMPVAPHDADRVVANAIKLAEAFRARAMPVFLVHTTPSPDGKDALRPVADNALQLSVKRPADWAEIVPELGPREGDIVITKRQWGAFYGTELDLELRRRGIQTIVLCGISTNIGVESTARFAYEYGYQQIFVEDSTAARSTEEHEHTMNTIFTRLGRVRKTQDVLNALI